MDGYTVGEVARLARVSVRTLHHYDSIGLLTPSARSAGGYRLCADDHEMHRGLADIYTSDDRYIAAYDEIEPGLARYVRDAMYANADRAQGRDGAQDG